MPSTSMILLVALLAAAPPTPAGAQVAAPSLVTEDLPEEEAAPPRAAAPSAATATQRQPAGTAHPTRRGASRDAEPAAAPAPTPTPAATPTATPASTPTATSTIPSATAETVRSIAPVTRTSGELLRVWQARRRALREGDVAGAEEAQQRIVAVQEELAIRNLRAFAAAEVRDSQRALAARLEADAVAHAQLAARLAPDLPEAHLALARARFARDGGRPGPALSALASAAAAAARDPHTSRAVAADAFAALLAALLAASAAAVAVLLARRLHLFIHDFGDLPLVRAATPVQAALLALALLALPLALGLGPLVTIAGAVVAIWLYLAVGEKIVATVALLAFVAAPVAAGRAARFASFTGTIAEDVYEVEHGAGDAAAERLAERDRRAPLPAPALAALARHHKRRGDLAAAKRLYERVLDEGGRTGDVLVNLGNVHLLLGDADAAKAAWLDAADRAGSHLEALAAAQYNLSKLYVRQSALEQANEARRRAQQVAPEFIERNASENDFRANRYVIDVQLPPGQYAALSALDPAPAAIAEAARARLAGALPAHLWPWGPVALVALLWVVAAFGGKLGAARACEKCGRPACARCDGATALLCGQCVNVYVKKGVVEGRDRLRKDTQVRRRARWVRGATRAAAVLGGGTGHLARGEPLRGFLLLAALLFAVFLAVFHRGVLPPPQPSGLGAALRLGVAVPLGAVVYALALRDVFRKTRS